MLKGRRLKRNDRTVDCTFEIAGETRPKDVQRGVVSYNKIADGLTNSRSSGGINKGESYSRDE